LTVVGFYIIIFPYPCVACPHLYKGGAMKVRKFLCVFLIKPGKNPPRGRIKMYKFFREENLGVMAVLLYLGYKVRAQYGSSEGTPVYLDEIPGRNALLRAEITGATIFMLPDQPYFLSVDLHCYEKNPEDLEAVKKVLEKRGWTFMVNDSWGKEK